uniref:FAM228B n=1 Tax=Esox lucius TaxID=8010 RepID=A0A3P8ZP66_ESOLU
FLQLLDGCEWSAPLMILSFNQAKFKSDHQELRAITQSILDTENGFVKDLEHFLHQQEWAELRRRELLHRRWTERVWSPVQRSVENRVSQRCDEEVQMSPRGMFLRYINHCNTKDFVFLENYNPKEYNPFLLNINRPHYYTVTTPILRDPLSLQSCERMKEKGAILCCQTGIVRQLSKSRPETSGRNWYKVYHARVRGWCHVSGPRWNCELQKMYIHLITLAGCLAVPARFRHFANGSIGRFSPT